MNFHLSGNRIVSTHLTILPAGRASTSLQHPASILYKPIAGRYRPVSYPDGPITARYRFIKNAYWAGIAYQATYIDRWVYRRLEGWINGQVYRRTDNITKTRLYNFDPLKPHFYIVKLGFTEVYIILLILLKNIDCGYSLEPPRWGGSNEYPESMFWAGIWKISDFFIWKFSLFSL